MNKADLKARTKHFARMAALAPLLLAASWPGLAESLPRLKVSDNHRFLVTESGQPFFWLGGTAWELFHRLGREGVEKYLADRAKKGFTVIQAVVLAELGGLAETNTGERKFTPPTPGQELDWVLVLDDAAKGFPPPGARK